MYCYFCGDMWGQNGMKQNRKNLGVIIQSVAKQLERNQVSDKWVWKLMALQVGGWTNPFEKYATI